MMGLLALSTDTARASVVTYGCASSASCTVDELNNGGMMSIDGALFWNWLILVDGTAATAPDLTKIEVSAIDDASKPGLRFTANGQLGVSGEDPSRPGSGVGNSISLQIWFDMLLLEIHGSTLALESHHFGSGSGGFVDLLGSIWNSSSLPLPDTYVYSYRPSPEWLLDDVHFSSQAAATGRLSILVWADSSDDDVALHQFSQQFHVTQVPEPATSGLLLLGLVVAMLSRRRAIRRKNERGGA